MATIAINRPGPSAERRFYFGMALAILAIVFAGFAPSFYLRGMVPAYAPYLPMTWLVLLHGLLFSTWLLIFMAQVSLISAGRPDVHRRLGLIAFVILPALLVVAVLAALHGVARASGPPDVPPLSWLAVPLLDVPIFGGLIAAALYNRRNAQVHKRLMLCAFIAMTPPAVGRLPVLQTYMSLPVVTIGGQLLLLAALAAWDRRSRGRVHPVTIIATMVIVGSWVFRFAIWQTGPWLAFAQWAVSFVA